MADENGGLNFKLIIVIVLLVIFLATGTSFMVLTYFSSNANETQEKQVSKNEMGPTHTLGEFVVNLSLGESYSFLKTNIVVEVSDNKVIESLKKRGPQIKDIIITILRKQKIEDIKQPAAKIIKNQIELRLNNILVSGEVTNVWFTEFVVQ